MAHCQAVRIVSPASTQFQYYEIVRLTGAYGADFFSKFRPYLFVDCRDRVTTIKHIDNKELFA